MVCFYSLNYSDSFCLKLLIAFNLISTASPIDKKPPPLILFYKSRILALLRNNKKKMYILLTNFSQPRRMEGISCPYWLSTVSCFLPYGNNKHRRFTRVKLGGMKELRLSNYTFSINIIGSITLFSSPPLQGLRPESIR